MSRRLTDLFWNCKVDGENFKGTAFELYIQNQRNLVLPTNECINFEGEKRQIDASFEKDDILLIIECKAINISFDFDRGKKKALQFRKNKYNKAIDEVDDKLNG